MKLAKHESFPEAWAVLQDGLHCFLGYAHAGTSPQCRRSLREVEDQVRRLRRLIEETEQEQKRE